MEEKLDIKIISLVEINATTKKAKVKKEKKMRVETTTWGLVQNDLEHLTQLQSLQDNVENNHYLKKLINHIKCKLSCYKRQDMLKYRYSECEFVSLNETIELLNTSQMKCCYCSENVYVLYEKVREEKQWSLDRINNDLGHNNGNVVISCLECNLKRRRTNKDAFMFAKNMIVIKKE
jgi:hypothetical protein